MFYIRKFRMLWGGGIVWLFSLAHEPVWAVQSNVAVHTSQAFSDKARVPPFFFSIRSWARGSTTDVKDYPSLGLKVAVGPCIEWKPWNGMGIQVGLLYGYNFLLPLDAICNGKQVASSSLISFFRELATQLKEVFKENTNNLKDDVLSLRALSLTFHAFVIPLFLRFYPVEDLVCYVGGYGAVPFGLSTHLFPSVRVTKDKLYSLLAEILMSKNVKNTLQGDLVDVMKLLKNNFISDAVWGKDLDVRLFNFDIGCEFQSKRSGLILGINWLGITLGYDFTKLLLKQK